MASEQTEMTQKLTENDTVTAEHVQDVSKNNTETTEETDTAGKTGNTTGAAAENVKETQGEIGDSTADVKETQEKNETSPTHSVGQNDVEGARLLSGTNGSLVSFHDIVYTVKATPSGKCCSCCRSVQKEILHHVR